MKFILTTIILIICSGCKNSKMMLHRGQNFEIEYPSNWIKMEQANVLLFFPQKEGGINNFQENINFILQDLSQYRMTLDQFTDLTINQLVAFDKGFEMQVKKSITLAGQETMELVYVMTNQNSTLKFKQYYFIKDDMAYIFTYTAKNSNYDKYDKAATQLIKSFTFFSTKSHI